VNCAVEVEVDVEELVEPVALEPPNPLVPEPVEEEAPDDPAEPEDEPPDDEPFVTTSPTARLTAVTMPAIGEARVVPLYAVCAASTEAWATATAAWSAVILATAALLPSLAV
jgi:hypothetical protein